MLGLVTCSSGLNPSLLATTVDGATTWQYVSGYGMPTGTAAALAIFPAGMLTSPPTVYPTLYSVNCGSRSLCWAAGGFPASHAAAASLWPAAVSVVRKQARGLLADGLRRRGPLFPRTGSPESCAAARVQGPDAMAAVGASATNGVILRSINGGTVWSVRRGAAPSAPSEASSLGRRAAPTTRLSLTPPRLAPPCSTPRCRLCR